MVQLWWDYLQTKALIIFEGHIDVVRGCSISYFPCVDNYIAFAASLEGHQIELFQAFPVVEVAEASYFSCEIALDTFNFSDILNFRGVPDWAAVF